MNYLVILFFDVMFLSCFTHEKYNNVHESANVIVDSDKSKLNVSSDICYQDSIVELILKRGKRDLHIKEVMPKPDVLFASGFSEDVSFTSYRLFANGINFEFRQTVYAKSIEKSTSIRSVFLNEMPSIICNVKNEPFNLDSIQMQIIYSESEIYYLDNNQTYLLVVSHPMNWVGTMTRHSFFQLINCKEKWVAEFIREDEL